MQSFAFALAVIINKSHLASPLPLLEPHSDIVGGRQDLVAVHVGISWRRLAILKFKFITVEEVDEEPLDLQDCQFLARTTGAESDERVLDLLAVFVKFCAVEAIVVEFLSGKK